MTTTAVQQIQESAARNIALLSRLDRILDEETEALRRREVDTIHRVLDGKLTLLHELEIAGREFIDLTSRHGIDPRNDSINNWLGSTDLAAASRHLRQLLAGCEAKNLANGNVIDVNRKFVENLLAILGTGHAPARTYDRSGHIGSDSGSQARATI